MEKNMMVSKKIALVLMAALLTSSCARKMESNVYTSSSTVGKVIEGTVISARPVVIQNNDKLENNGMGMLGGGVLGAVAGSGFGKGTGQGVAAVGGALIGAAAGALVQSQLGKSQGMEYIVRIDSKYVNDIPETVTKKEVKLGTDSVEDDVKGATSVQKTKTDLISVIQGQDTTFQAGQKVLVIYNDDRPRLAAAY